MICPNCGKKNSKKSVIYTEEPLNKAINIRVRTRICSWCTTTFKSEEKILKVISIGKADEGQEILFRDESQNLKNKNKEKKK